MSGDLVQLIRSPDSTIGAPDPVTGNPAGNDSVADTTTYLYPVDVFQGDDWSETEGYYVCVRIWNADTTLAGTYYWDSPVYQAIGLLPIDIYCDGAQTDKAKGQATPTPTETSPPTPSATPTITPTPQMTPTPTVTATVSPLTPTPTATPSVAPTGIATASPSPVVALTPNKTELTTGDSLAMDLSISERISGMGRLVMYVLVRTPEGTWFSFVPGKGGGFDMERGIKPAASGAVIPSINVPILKQNITTSLARGDYWFISAVFRAADRITLANWRSLAIYSSEVTVTVK